MKSPVLDKNDIADLKIGSPSTIDRMEAAGQFPPRFTLSPGSRRVFWRRADVVAWLRDRGIELDTSAQPAAASTSSKPHPVSTAVEG